MAATLLAARGLGAPGRGERRALGTLTASSGVDRPFRAP